MRIAVDAMGSDNFPAPDVAGAIQAAQDFGDTIILVGDEGCIKTELEKHNTVALDIEIQHAAEHIAQDHSPVRRTKTSRIHRFMLGHGWWLMVRRMPL